MNAATMTLTQLRYVNKAFWRNPASAFFTFAFPLMFLAIFTALLGNGDIVIGGRTVSLSTYYVAGMTTFAVITACYNNIAISLTFQRDLGVLKRTNGTPLPAAVYLSARVLHALFVSLLLVVITVAFGSLLYGADIPTGADLARFLAVLAVGAASFCALGFRGHRHHPERGRRRTHRQRDDPADAVPVRDLHPHRGRCAGLAHVDRAHLSRQALRRWDPGRLRRYCVPLERRARRRRLGTRPDCSWPFVSSAGSRVRERTCPLRCLCLIRPCRWALAARAPRRRAWLCSSFCPLHP